MHSLPLYRSGPRTLLALAISTFALLSPAAEKDRTERVSAAVEALAASSGMATGTVGVAILPVKEGPVIYDHEGSRSLVPASAMKLITTGSALHHLGPDYRFPTTLQTDTEGNVFVRGSGDPSFAEYSSEALFDVFTAKLKEAGIKEIVGSVIGDASAYGTQLVPDTWQYYDMGNYFGAGAASLNFRRNTYRVYFKPGSSVGAPAKYLRCNPSIPGLQFTNEMRTGSSNSGDRGFIYVVPYGDHAFLRGTIPAGRSGFSIKGSIPDPALTCAQFFDAHLEKHDFPTTGTATTMRRLAIAGTVPKAERKDIYTHQSKPLSELIKSTNHFSINLHAESFLRAVALKKTGRGDIKAGAATNLELVGSFGINTTGLHIADGSGLSRLNGVTPRQFVYILKGFHNGEHGKTFVGTLPIAGKTGTMKYIAGGTSAAGRIYAKSGTLERTKCYVGYADANSGKRYAFAIMINNFTGDYYPIKKGIEKIMTALSPCSEIRA